MDELSPMMRQYFDIKRNYPDSILFFRMGDFYEMFYDDAEKASKELDLVLTKKNCGKDQPAPMCGVPFHSSEAYVSRLVAKGFRVAICEQTEDPAKAKGLVKREVIRVITPGTVIEESMLDESRNNYLAAVLLERETAAVCFVDASTGEARLTSFAGETAQPSLLNELGRYMPSEVLLSDEAGKSRELTRFLKLRLGCVYGDRPELFGSDAAEKTVLAHFKKKSAAEIGIGEDMPAVRALGAALSYLYETRMSGLENITEADYYSGAQYMLLDISARRNLELIATMRAGEKRGTLLWVLDKTKTAMGKRLIRSWIQQPLISCAQILKRQNAVRELFDDSILRADIAQALIGVHDLERLMTRIVYGTANARELVSLADTLKRLPSLREVISECKAGMLTEIHRAIDELADVYSLIDQTIAEEPPFSVKDGGIIKAGYSAEVDLLRSDMTDGKGVIAGVQEREREKTGIKSLKVGYNKVFGYYIEVSNSYKTQVPEDYIRKQTLVNGERFITQELKELEARVLGAKDRARQLEYEIFEEVRKKTALQLHRIQRTAQAVSCLDVILSFAQTAAEGGYVCPEIGMDGKVEITDGRHPVLETMLDIPFVPNDVKLNVAEDRCLIITGPNMAGKSTYMRQTALITIMAQTGSFVPAKSAYIGIVDAVFTRVGASDDLAAGQSTFMVEMTEVANILTNATKNSLLIFDEIGRGTSTFDGMSIARAVVEYVCDKKKLGAKTLFATHYHELTELEDQLDGVKNYNIAVKKRGDEITFLRRIVRGGADDSYGIEVAKLAGVPDEIVNRARQVLKSLETQGHVQPKSAGRKKSILNEDQNAQLTMGFQAENEIIKTLKQMDINTLTPIEAMAKLYDMINRAQKIDG